MQGSRFAEYLDKIRGSCREKRGGISICDVDPGHVGQVLDIPGYKKKLGCQVRKLRGENMHQRAARLIEVNAPNVPVVILNECMPNDPTTAHAKITNDAKWTGGARWNTYKNLLESSTRDAPTDSKDRSWLGLLQSIASPETFRIGPNPIEDKSASVGATVSRAEYFYV